GAAGAKDGQLPLLCAMQATSMRSASFASSMVSAATVSSSSFCSPDSTRRSHRPPTVRSSLLTSAAATWRVPLSSTIRGRVTSRFTERIVVAEPSRTVPNRGDVAELADSVPGQLTPVARPLDPAEGERRMGRRHPVHEHPAGLQVPHEPDHLVLVPRPHVRTEAEGGVVVDHHRLVQVR